MWFGSRDESLSVVRLSGSRDRTQTNRADDRWLEARILRPSNATRRGAAEAPEKKRAFLGPPLGIIRWNFGGQKEAFESHLGIYIASKLSRTECLA